MRGGLALLSTLALLAFPGALAGGIADTTLPFDQTVTIPADDYAAFSFPPDPRVTAVAEVVQGDPVDVFVTSRAGYDLYADPEALTFTYLPDHTRRSVLLYNLTILDDASSLVLIVDNTNWTSSGARASGPVRVRVAITVVPVVPRPSPSPWGTLAVLAVAVLLAAGAILLYRHAKRREKEAERQKVPPGWREGAAQFPPPATVVAPTAWPPPPPPPPP